MHLDPQADHARRHGPLTDTCLFTPAASMALSPLVLLWNTSCPTLNLTPLLFSKVQVSEGSDSNPFSLSSYFLCDQFRARDGWCVCVWNDLIFSHVPELESSEFSTLCLRETCHTLTSTTYICTTYLWTDCSEFFGYLNFTAEKFLTFSLSSKISSLGGFRVHHCQWFSFISDTLCKQAFVFTPYCRKSS